MILRSLMDHVKEQNWTAVWLDFVIVVAGVLLAFQINAWNEGRAEHQRERVYLSQIAEDLHADIEETKDVRQAATWRMSAIHAILDAAGVSLREEFSLPGGVVKVGPVPVFDNPDPHAAMMAVSALDTLDGARHTYQSLISTGEFRLIRDPELARAIQSYYVVVDGARDFENAVRSRYQMALISGHRHGLSAGADITVEELGEIVASDRQYAAELETYWGLSELHRRRMEVVALRAQELIDKIEAANK